jgi:hypothetical protein
MTAPDYVRNRVWQDYPSTATLVRASDMNNIELGLEDASASAHAALTATASGSGASIVAPAPSGGDDTAALQPLVTQAQTTGGTLILRPGLYKANLATAQSANQPRIVGQGKNHSALQGQVNTAPVVRFKGATGQLSGGYLSDLTIQGTGGVGWEIADASGVRWSRIEFGGTLAEGLRFHNEATGAVTEFNSGDAEFQPTVVLPVRYMHTNGGESFQGSGFTQGTSFNQRTGQTTPFIQIDASCFPFNAPLTAAFTSRTTTPLIRNSNTTRNAHFHGAVTVQLQTGGAGTVLVDAAGQPVQFSGFVTAQGQSGFDQGNLRLNDVVYFGDTVTVLGHKTTKVSVPLSSTSAGDLGQWAADTSFVYFVVAQDVWRRVPAATF